MSDPLVEDATARNRERIRQNNEWSRAHAARTLETEILKAKLRELPLNNVAKDIASTASGESDFLNKLIEDTRVVVAAVMENQDDYYPATSLSHHFLSDLPDYVPPEPDELVSDVGAVPQARERLPVGDVRGAIESVDLPLGDET